MSGWGSLNGLAETDFLTRYMSQSCSPLYRINNTELQFSPSPPGGTVQSYENTATMTQFCGEHNVEDCLAYLNTEVTTLGMAPLYDSRTVSFDVVRMVNCLHDLLQKHQNSARIREELENRQHRTEADMMRLQLLHERLKESLRQYERELMQQQEKDRQLTNKNKLLSTKLKAEKDEVRRLQSVMQHRDVQYQHEQRKGDREMTRLKDRLHQLLMDKTERKIGIDISNSLQRSDGKRGVWRTGTRDQEDMYRLVISNYEEKQKELMEENSDLRQCLSDMQKELHALLGMRTNRTRTSSQSHIDGDTSDWSDCENSTVARPTEEMSDGHFQMPYECVRDSIEKSLKEKCRLLRLYIRNIEKQPGGSKSPARRESTASVKTANDEKHSRETEKLNKQINRYREIIEQQEILIQQTLQPTPPPTAQLSDEANSFMIESESEFLDAAKKFFSEQKANFEDERQKFTEAAIRLGREKVAFEEEKAAFLKEQFFKMSPFKDHSRSVSESSVTPEVTRGKRLLPSTPSYQEAPPRHLNFSTPVSLSRPQSGPSTADLYRALGLTSNSSVNRERRELPKLRGESPAGVCHMTCENGSSPVSVGTATTSSSTSPMSNMSVHRLAEHVDNVKLALRQKHSQDTDSN
ncbi:hypothetical protein NP493_659g01066 [Ridgeia piscesae]|uniref:Uncharacterized protein n=1 Tax=Ridgeia piscesae TaxID=27915 RepID=A0AAD9KSG2_RIDPI|nr:hypothetical protein NP493_659g01066 [Ridgeia piscesae]